MGESNQSSGRGLEQNTSRAEAAGVTLLASTAGDTREAASCGLLEGLVERLLLGGRQDWAEAFRQVVLSLGGGGGEVGIIGPPAFLGTTGDPQIILSCGAYYKTSDRQDIIKFFYNYWRRRDVTQECSTTLLGPDPVIACCALPYSKNEVLGIVIWGEPSDGFADLTLLRLFARLLAHARGSESHASNSPLIVQTEDRKFPDGYVEGCSAAMMALHREIEMLSQVDIPVLLLGETGVGKEHLAQLLHQWSARQSGPFIAVNCAAIPAELLEAEMFGIGRGVASGVAEREGYFQLADRGTLFLDEVAELHLPLQAKLLRALQEKEVRRVGGSTVKPNVRIIAATNADLRGRMEEGSFRPDLYYRIAGFELLIPPLRERKGDLPLLLESFIQRFSGEAGKIINGITLKALEALNEYDWPGNVREFAHEVRRLVYLCPHGQPIDTQLFSLRVLSSGAGGYGKPGTSPSILSLDAATEKLERQLISEALRRTGGNRTQAAKLLGVTRNGLAIKMERLGLKI
jgi:DNA-binding NtrC family response regulator